MMAYFVLRSEGVCNTQPCRHIDCSQTIGWAESKCPYCNETIGWEKKVVFIAKSEDHGEIAHFICRVEHLEAQGE